MTSPDYTVYSAVRVVLEKKIVKVFKFAPELKITLGEVKAIPL